MAPWHHATPRPLSSCSRLSLIPCCLALPRPARPVVTQEATPPSSIVNTRFLTSGSQFKGDSLADARLPQRDPLPYNTCVLLFLVVVDNVSLPLSPSLSLPFFLSPPPSHAALFPKWQAA